MKIVITLWQRFAESSQWWIQKMGEARIGGQLNPAVQTWANGLAGMTPDQIKAGFRAWVDSGKGIPDLPQFKALCRGDDKQHLNADMYTPFRGRKAITDETKKIRNSIAARNGLADLKKILGR